MPTFEELLSYAEKKLKAQPSLTDCWQGYIRGLHRGHYGHDTGLDEEREWQVEESEQGPFPAFESSPGITTC